MLKSDSRGLLTVACILTLLTVLFRAVQSSPRAGARHHHYSTDTHERPALENTGSSAAPEAPGTPGVWKSRMTDLIDADDEGQQTGRLPRASASMHDWVDSGPNPRLLSRPLRKPEPGLEYGHTDDESSRMQARLSRYIKRARVAELEGFKTHGNDVDAAGGGFSSQALDKGSEQEHNVASSQEADSIPCCDSDSALLSCNGAAPQFCVVGSDTTDNPTGTPAYPEEQPSLLSNTSSPDADNPISFQGVMRSVQHYMQVLSQSAPRWVQFKPDLVVKHALAVISAAVLLILALRRQHRHRAKKSQEVKDSCSVRSCNTAALHAATADPAACNNAQAAAPSSGSSFTGEDSAGVLSSDSDSSGNSSSADAAYRRASNMDDKVSKVSHTRPSNDSDEPFADSGGPITKPGASATTPPAAAAAARADPAHYSPAAGSPVFSMGHSGGEPSSSKDSRNSLKAARRGFVPSPRPRKRLTPSRDVSPTSSETGRSAVVAAPAPCVDEDGEEGEEASGVWFPRGAVLSPLGDVGSPIAMTPARSRAPKSSAAGISRPSGMAPRSTPATPAPRNSPSTSPAAGGDAPDTGGSIGAESPSLEILESLLSGYASRLAKSSERSVLTEAVKVVRQRCHYRQRRRQQRQQVECMAPAPELLEWTGPTTSATSAARGAPVKATGPAGIRSQATAGGSEGAGGSGLAGAGAGYQPWRDVGAAVAQSSWSIVAVGDCGGGGGGGGMYLPPPQPQMELPQLMYSQAQESRADPLQPQDQQLQLLSASIAGLMAAPAPLEGLNPAWAVAVATAHASRQMAEMTTVMKQMAGQMVDLGSGMRELNGGVREGSGLLRTLVVGRELEVQRALAAAAMQRGVWVMWVALAVGSYKWGRLTTVLSRCSVDPTFASSATSTALPCLSRSPLSYAGWAALRSLSWVARLGKSASTGSGGVTGGGAIGFLGRLVSGGLALPSWLGRVWCYTSELGLLSFGGLLLVYCILPLLRRTSALDLSRSWQLDIPLVLGCVWGLVGAQVVHCLGGKWTVWLLGWWVWCLAGGLMHAWRLRSGWAQAAAGLLLGLLCPAALGVMAYAGWGLPAHLALEDWWLRLWVGELGAMMSWSG